MTRKKRAPEAYHYALRELRVAVENLRALSAKDSTLREINDARSEVVVRAGVVVNLLPPGAL